MIENDLQSMPPPPAQTPMRTPTPHQLPTATGVNLPSSYSSNHNRQRDTYSYFDQPGTVDTQTPVRRENTLGSIGTGNTQKKNAMYDAEASSSSNFGPCPSVTKAPRLDVPTSFGTPRCGGDQRQGRQVLLEPMAEAAPDSNTSTHYSTTSSNISSPPGTPFRFTSFPASLPRVHPRSILNSHSHIQSREELQLDFGDTTTKATAGTSTPAVHHHKGPFQSPYRKNSASKNRLPGTVRKRMTFTDGEYENDEDGMCDPPEHDCSDYRDDSQSQNTSLSSLSVDGTSSNYFGKTPSRMVFDSIQGTPFRDTHATSHGNHASGVTSRAVWLSPILSDEKQKAAHLNMDGSSEEMGMDVNSTGGRSGNENKNGDIIHPNDNQDLWTRSTINDPPLRTRLNFNSMFSPDTGNSDAGDRKRHSVSDDFQDLKDGTLEIWMSNAFVYIDVTLAWVNTFFLTISFVIISSFYSCRRDTSSKNGRQKEQSLP